MVFGYPFVDGNFLQKLRRQSVLWMSFRNSLSKEDKKVEQNPSTNGAGIPLTETFSVSDNIWKHRLRTPREERTFTAQPKIKSQSQIFRYGRSIFMSATSAQFFRFLWFMPSLGVRSPCLETYIWFSSHEQPKRISSFYNEIRIGCSYEVNEVIIIKIFTEGFGGNSKTKR